MKRDVQQAPAGRTQAVVLFDGVCNLCNGAVHFIIDRDPDGFFRFASLQSEAARPWLARARLPAGYLDSFVLVLNGQSYQRSDAALEIARRLHGPWKLLYALRVLPRPLRDRLYDAVAQRRYRWFGKQETCRLPTPELQARFLG